MKPPWRRTTILRVLGTAIALTCWSCSPRDATMDAGGRSEAGSRDGEGSREGSVPPSDGSGSDGQLPDASTGCLETMRTSTRTEAGLEVVHRDGQSFVTWADRAEGAAGASIRYRVYRSKTPLLSTADLEEAELIGIALNNSARMFGWGFNEEQRINPDLPMSVIDPGGDPLPLWSGLWVATSKEDGCAYYAVLATTIDGEPLEDVEPGMNATTEPIAERVAERIPIKVYDSNERPRYVEQTRITGTPNLPLRVMLHPSNAQGGPVFGGEVGDYWLYFSDSSMGYQDGMPGVFSVQENHSGPPYLIMRNRDTILHPNGRPLETHWFGYVSDTPGGRFAYPFTERRMDWMVSWVVDHYRVDPNRVYVFGGSMGAWGTMTYAFRRPERFAAVYPDRPRFRQRSLSNVTPRRDDIRSLTLPDGTPWLEHHDSIQFVRSHPGDLPFVGWNVGRRDGFATWEEQVDMVRALTDGRHGFAFAWNNGDHSSGRSPYSEVLRWYPPRLFSLNQSYPAFTNSSIDDDIGNGDPEDGDLEGGINLGFLWTVVEDSSERWVLEVSNELLGEGVMTVDITPRRLQSFRPRSGASISYRWSAPGAPEQLGSVLVDENSLITIESLEIQARTTHTLVLSSL